MDNQTLLYSIWEYNSITDFGLETEFTDLGEAGIYYAEAKARVDDELLTSVDFTIYETQKKFVGNQLYVGE